MKARETTAQRRKRCTEHVRAKVLARLQKTNAGAFALLQDEWKIPNETIHAAALQLGIE